MKIVTTIPLLALAMAAYVSPAAAAVSEAARTAVESARSYGAAVRSCDMGWALDYMYPPLKKLYAEQLSNRSGKESENARRIMGLTKESPEQAKARLQTGLKALREHYVNMGKQMQASGVKIESFTVRDPVAEYVVSPPRNMATAVRRDAEGRISADQLQGSGERSRVVVLPTVLVVSAPTRSGSVTRVERRGHIFAIRDEVVNGGVDRNGFTVRDTKLNRWYFVDGNTDANTLRTFFPNLPLHMTLPDGGERVLR